MTVSGAGGLLSFLKTSSAAEILAF